MKLVVLAVALVAIASAAPRGVSVESIVPEESELVQSSTTASDVEMLKQQFHELELQIKDGATPGVINVINKMIQMVEGEIQQSIIDAHKTDQSTVNSKMKKIQDLNHLYTDNVKNLNEKKDQIVRMIDDAHAQSQLWEKHSLAFTKTQNSYLDVHGRKEHTCCEKDNAGVVDVEYVPAFATCDYVDVSTSNGKHCGAQAVKAVENIVTEPFTKGLALWRKLLAKCNKLTAQTDKENTLTENAIKLCQSTKLETKKQEKATQAEQDQWNVDWDTTIANYNGNYTAMLKDYKTTKKRVKKDMADRKAEHRAVHEINCMLKAYRDGGSFHHASREECQSKINAKHLYNIQFPKVVKQLSWKKHKYRKFIDASAYESTCDKRTPAPIFECVVKPARPYPKCSTSSGHHKAGSHQA